ncbi:cysteine proteinase [Aspergillus campestris IBT 28561]|uniref:ubiquitinyl hydrolase 1 n=1 Tax=Aspergillus campestris (strain IBT 28561) TaxID=1392248 RepID=A0A2I1CPY9_ASPC2|nr:cysteine proteinase [Aspergillus campestris IBT 28561]PKX99692.1 cysteine proteinase [Aspergillus campestris IBT 28561]
MCQRGHPASQAVYREDCTQCFDSIDDDSGLNVCLTCFNGGCTGDRDHALLHFQRFGHPLALNIKRSRKPSPIAETEDDHYDTNTRVVCYKCCQDNVDVSSANFRLWLTEVKAWEQEFVPCEHTLCLDLNGCSLCDLKENLCFMAPLMSSAIKCNEERVDPNLADHLAHWGINLAGREKTEKSLTEMQIEQNMKWQFTMTSEDGQELTPIFGPGLTGLRNLGNSCYLSSVIQCLFDLPQFQNRVQLRKLADGILSGRYSRPDPDAIVAADSPETPNQKGLVPSMFKHLVGRGHEEFSTMRQQDAFEFLLHLFKLVNHGSFAVEQRLQCLNCSKVRYRVDEQDNLSIPVPVRRFSTESDHETSDQFQTVTFNECLDASTADEVVELSCPSCSSKSGFSKHDPFRSRWLSFLRQKEDKSYPDVENTESIFAPDEEVLCQLLTMGFPQPRCVKALQATGNSDVEAAMNWILLIWTTLTLMIHLRPKVKEPQQDSAKVLQLGEMGINEQHAKKALACYKRPLKGFSTTPARYQLRSIICHKGSSHYVAFVRKTPPRADQPTWVMFNDEKVVRSRTYRR